MQTNYKYHVSKWQNVQKTPCSCKSLITATVYIKKPAAKQGIATEEKNAAVSDVAFRRKGIVANNPVA